jgi:type I restriction enzyme S subunit
VIRTRLDWIASSARDTVSLDEMRQYDLVAHYSIPNFDLFGGAADEDPQNIESSKLRVGAGDLLVSRLNPRKQRVLFVERHETLAVCSGEFVVLRPTEAVDPRFLYWRLLAEDTRQHLDARVRSVTRSQQRVEPDEIRKYWMYAPALADQRLIVRRLDEATTRIDALIREQQGLIVSLLERRASELDRWVEHGGGTDLVDVSSRWINAIPRDWSLMPLKRCVSRVMVGIVINPSAYYEEDGVPVLRGLNIRPGRVTNDDLVYMSAASNELHRKSILCAGDVVVVRTGAAGSAAVVPEWAVGGNAVDLLIVRPGERLLPAFLEHLLNSRLVQQQVLYGSVGALQSHFNTSALANVMVVVPPPTEQERVLEHLTPALSRYDELIAGAGRQIELLREHRQALITAGVTGGLDALGRVA